MPLAKAEVKLVRKTYMFLDETLYKRSYNGTLLRCLYLEKARSVIEICEGTCSAGAYTMARRSILQRYF
nr:uncharacterized protein LOC109191268 [Ipomoea batatas]